MQPSIKNDLVYLLRILESIGKIRVYTADFTDAIDFFRANNQQNFNASLMLLINIGEQSTRVSDELKSKYSTINWLQIRGFRNRIAHDYIGIDRFITFDIIQHELPILKAEIENVIRTEILSKTFDKEEYELAKQSEFYINIDYDSIV
ncbi:MAG: DUF86 domain-containing protein [Spirosomaceae bacterium]|jgi:uncharacterized protein with HEPN domain|nr:DUF86 domain-containing protein [Spirosomataceae bacterium]